MIKSYIHFISLLAFMLSIAACGSGPKKTTKLDLMSYGLPITINAPDSSEVEMDDMLVVKEVTVKSGDEYSLLILSSKATSNDISSMKSKALAEVKDERYFSKIIQEDEDGFIFEKQVDEKIFYDFRYFKIQGDSEYSFRTGFVGFFTEEQVRDMYASVK